MKMIIQVTNMEHTGAIETYITKKLGTVEKLLKERKEAILRAEAGMSTKHHKKGDVFFCEVNIHIKGKEFRFTEQSDDLYRAIDLVKIDMMNEVSSYLDKQRGTKRKGGQEAKKAIRS